MLVKLCLRRSINISILSGIQWDKCDTGNEHLRPETGRHRREVGLAIREVLHMRPDIAVIAEEGE